jgi:hypothetical protein
MKFSTEKWKNGPPAEALADPALEALRNPETLKRIQALAFQLRLCFDVKALWGMWDDESLPAWRAIARNAGGLIQRALVKETVLLCCHLIDERKDSSSIASFHKSRILKAKLPPGPFRQFYDPLYAEIVERGRELKIIRDEMIAHTNWGKLEVQLYGQRDAVWGDLNLSRLSETLTVITWYVQLIHCALGIRAERFERVIAGAEELRGAVLAAHREGDA